MKNLMNALAQEPSSESIDGWRSGNGDIGPIGECLRAAYVIDTKNAGR